MQFKPSLWFPIAVILAGLNLIAVPIYLGRFPGIRLLTARSALRSPCGHSGFEAAP